MESVKQEGRALKALHVVVSMALMSMIGLGSAHAQSTCENEVPEASTYSLVYRLPIPIDSNFSSGGVPYDLDNTGSIGAFDRIGYCLELDAQWVWVSMAHVSYAPDERSSTMESCDSGV